MYVCVCVCGRGEHQMCGCFKLRLHLSIWVKVQKRSVASVWVRRSNRSTGSDCLWFLTVCSRPSVSSCRGVSLHVSSPGALATTLDNASSTSSRRVSCMCLKLISNQCWHHCTKSRKNRQDWWGLVGATQVRFRHKNHLVKVWNKCSFIASQKMLSLKK